MISGISSSFGRFSLLVVHIGSGLLEEGIECLGWLDAYSLSEFHAREESPLEQVPLYMVPAGDLDGLPVEAVNEFSQGLIVFLDDGLECCFDLRVPS